MLPIQRLTSWALALSAGVFGVSALAAPLVAQPAPLTLTDLLDVRATSAGALSEDGRWLVVTMTRPRTSLGIDYNRSFGDPTYVAPARRESFIVDTRTGERSPLFPTPRVIAGSAWTPDGSTLAVLVHASDPAADDRFEVLLIDRATRRQTALRLPANRYAFERSRLQWSSDGRRLYLSLRSTAWRGTAKAEFARLTTGPRIVQSSEEPFLAWNGLQRLGSMESVVVIDRRTGSSTDVLAEAMRPQWAVTRDGRTIVHADDITRRTDYDVIGGTEQRLMARDVAGGAETVIFPALRNIRLVWARDGRRQAYTRDDQLWVGTVGDSVRTRLAGDTTARGDTTADARARRQRERFTPVSWIEGDAPALLASNVEGLWLLDPVTRARRLVLRAVDSLPSLPRAQFIGAVANGQQLLFALQ